MEAQRRFLTVASESTPPERQAAVPVPASHSERVPADQQPLSGPPEPPDNLPSFLAAAQEELRHEFAVSERLEAKSRNQVTLCVALWGAAQTVALAALGSGSISTEGKVGIGFFALCGLLAIGEAVRRSFEMWKARPQGGVSPTWIKDLVDEHRHNATALGTMAKKYANLVDARRDLNVDRASDLEEARPWCWGAAAVAVLQVALVVIFRLAAS